MAGEAPHLKRYRRFLIAFVLTACAVAGAAGVWLVARGLLFAAFLALLCVGFFLLLAHGYRQDERERNP